MPVLSGQAVAGARLFSNRTPAMSGGATAGARLFSNRVPAMTGTAFAGAWRGAVPAGQTLPAQASGMSQTFGRAGEDITPTATTTWTYWNGIAESPLTLAGEWNGSTTQPLSVT